MTLRATRPSALDRFALLALLALSSCANANGPLEGDAEVDDVTRDAAIDDVDDDVASDAFDAASDHTLDARADAPVDLASDTTVDTGFDAAVDTGFDAAVDTGFDAAVDTGFDAAVDTGFDAAVDRGFDAAVDARDAVVDTGFDAAVDARDASVDVAADVRDAAVDVARDTGAPLGGCVSGAAGTYVARFRWTGSGSGSRASVSYEANTLPDHSRWRVTANSRSIGYTPVFSDIFLGVGGLELTGTNFIDVELSTAGIGSIAGVTIAIFGRSYNTTASGSFAWQTFDGVGAAPSGIVANSAPYEWYRADATRAFTPGNGSVLLRITPGPPSGALIVNRVELCFDAR